MDVTSIGIRWLRSTTVPKLWGKTNHKPSLLVGIFGYTSISNDVKRLPHCWLLARWILEFTRLVWKWRRFQVQTGFRVPSRMTPLQFPLPSITLDIPFRPLLRFDFVASETCRELSPCWFTNLIPTYQHHPTPPLSAEKIQSNNSVPWIPITYLSAACFF